MEEQDTSHSTSSDSIASDSVSYDFEESQTNPGIISRVAGGAYNATTTVVGGAANIVGGAVGGAANATVSVIGGAKNVASAGIGGAGWIAGSALSTSMGLMKGMGSYVLPARFKPVPVKDKSE